MIFWTVFDLANVALLYNLQNPRVATRQSSGLNFFLHSNNNFVCVLQPYVFRAECISPKQHSSLNCCFCQGSFLGFYTASPSLGPHFCLFCSSMDAPSVPLLRRGHIAFEGGESHTNVCYICLFLSFLASWVDGWLVGCLVGWFCE
jgi:hypothetical protein